LVAKAEAMLEAGDGAGPSVIGRAFLALERQQEKEKRAKL
jgi:hypothetical protein